MGKYVQWITHRDVRILYLKVRGLNEADNLAALEELKQELLKEKSGVPLLFDQAGAAMTKKTADKSKEVSVTVRAAGVPAGPSAVVGLTGLQKVVVQVFGQGAHYFDTVDEAKEWLVRETEKAKKP